MASKFAFVAVDGDRGKVKEEDRDLVRSRCMIGKNKREGSRRSLREAKSSTILEKRNKHQPISVPPNNRSENDDANFGAGKRYSQPSLGREMIRFVTEDTATYPREMAFISRSER